MPCCRRSLICLSISAVFLIHGCQKLDMQKTQEVLPGDVVAPFIVESPSGSHDVTVIVDSSAPVDVFIATIPDLPAFEKNPKLPKTPLTSQTKVQKETTLTAKVPAKTSYAVILGNAEKTATVSVKLKAK